MRPAEAARRQRKRRRGCRRANDGDTVGAVRAQHGRSGDEECGDEESEGQSGFAGQ